LIQPFLDAFPEAEVYGIDFDPALLPLAQERLRRYGARARLLLADLRGDEWRERVLSPLDAAISATALHWLRETELAALYRRLSTILRPGGIFLNADHVGSQHPGVQAFWERNRDELRRTEGKAATGEDWDTFWDAYIQALGLPGQRQVNERVVGGWNGGIEAGLPLEWHLAQLKMNGFAHADCFWRCDCDAIYGGFR
jgi:SAM-dependent methyltransferase